MSASEAAGVSVPVYADNLNRGARRAPDAVPVEPNDETLLVRLQAGDMEALGLLFPAVFRLLLAIARRKLRDNHEAEDLVQDIFLFLFTRERRLIPPRAWRGHS